uniref:Uncharacterized protein n=1 Tax=Gredgaria maugeana TaxID=2007213 RepID=A0A1Z1MNH6_9FLOR|nr:hypothetical protein [Gredgaria maugeana]ARW67335.1 hypothetical protein [Gredgaria maugeana]
MTLKINNIFSIYNVCFVVNFLINSSYTNFNCILKNKKSIL